MSKTYRFKGEVWRWPGLGGWHFVSLPKMLSGDIRKLGRPRGVRFLRVRVTLGKSSWETALFPHRESQTYLISIKRKIREIERVWENDKVNLRLELIK